MADLTLEGSLSGVSVPDLLTIINLVGKTGTLTLQETPSKVVRRLFWRSGEIIFAASSRRAESLGRFLIRHGQISPAELEEIEPGLSPERRLGELLVDRGLLTPEEVRRWVKLQVLSIVYRCFRLSDGTFAFRETDRAHEQDILLKSSVTAILLEGIRRLDEWPRIARLIPDQRLIPVPATPGEQAEDPRLSPEERRVLELVDGRRSVGDIIRSSDMEEFETLRALATVAFAGGIWIPGIQVPHRDAESDESTAVEDLVDASNHVFAWVFRNLADYLPDEELRAVGETAIARVASPLLGGVTFDRKGYLNGESVARNVQELPSGRRAGAAESVLGLLVDHLLLEARERLAPEERREFQRRARERMPSEMAL